MNDSRLITDYKALLDDYRGKKVLVTGNTGFKGSWLTYILLDSGAQVTGYALRNSVRPNLFDVLGLEERKELQQFYNDVRDYDTLRKVFEDTKPEIVIHLAAQPIVRESYSDPMNTYTTNVNGTLNVLECIRTMNSVRSFLNVTTDKVYKNNEWEYGYREDDPLDGYDPYSNSKSCSELITHSYKASFFSDSSVFISTARAGNVIGGGDFSVDRIIPDCVRAIMDSTKKKSNNGIIGVRNPYSTRPYQHVLEPIFAYLMIAMCQYTDSSYAGYYNVGPDDCDCIKTGDLVSAFCDKWNKMKDESLSYITWKNQYEENAPHEASFLKLDCSRIKSKFGWQPRWHIDKAIEETVKWNNVWLSDGDIISEMNREIEEFIYG